MKLNNNVLVVLVKDLSDWQLAKTQKWYRIPLESRVPSILQNNTAKWIAFYFPKKFGNEKYSIRYYAKISSIKNVYRKTLFPDEFLNSKSEKIYRKISFDDILPTPQPILSHRGRMILFIPTSIEKLLNATELNDIFNDSPLEEKLWNQLKANKLPAERQFYIKTDEKSFICDFALFCKNGVINVECDGEQHQSDREMVIYDKMRNNEIVAVANWTVLRFTTDHINLQIDWTMQKIKQTIKNYGGFEKGFEDKNIFLDENPTQYELFAG